MTNLAVEAAGPQIETFATPAGRYLGYTAVGAALVLGLLGVKSQGTGAFSLIGFCVAFSALSWVALIRPRVTAHKNGLVLRNMVRDTFLPWASVKSCRVAQTLQIGTRDKIYHGLGLTKSARQATREQRRPRGGPKPVFGPNLGFNRMASPRRSSTLADDALATDKAKEQQTGGSYFSHAEQRIETLASQGAATTAGSAPKVVWDPVAIAGLVLAGLGVVSAFVS